MTKTTIRAKIPENVCIQQPPEQVHVSEKHTNKKKNVGNFTEDSHITHPPQKKNNSMHKKSFKFT